MAEVQHGEQDRSLVTVCGVSINISINISIWYQCQYQHLVSVSVSTFGISISVGAGALSEVLVNLESPTLVETAETLGNKTAAASCRVTFGLPHVLSRESSFSVHPVCLMWYRTVVTQSAHADIFMAGDCT